MITDTRKRPLHDLRISVTDRCNFRCPYCMPAEIYGEHYEFMKRPDLLTFEEIERLARIFVDLGRLHGEAYPLAIGLARSDPNPVVRRMAVFCLGKLAPHDDTTADALLDASRDQDRDVRRAALIAIAGLENQSKSASSE